MESLMSLIEQLKDQCIRNTTKIREEANLSPAEYKGISVLNFDESMSGNELSRKMKLSPSRASRVIDRLVKNGYLVRIDDPVDRRRSTVCLADQGIKIKNKITEVIGKCETRVFSALSEQEIKYFSSSIRKITKIL